MVWAPQDRAGKVPRSCSIPDRDSTSILSLAIPVLITKGMARRGLPCSRPIPSSAPWGAHLASAGRLCRRQVPVRRLPPTVANQRVHFDPTLCAVRTDSSFAVPAAGEEWQARLRSTSTSESRCSRRGQGAQSGGVPCSIATSPQWENRCASQTEIVTSRIWPCIS